MLLTRRALTRSRGIRVAEHAVDIPLLRDGQHVVDKPIEHQAGREEKEEYAERNRHDLHNLGLHWIRWLWVEARLNDHGGAHEDGQNIKGIGAGEVVYPEDKRRVPQL